MRGITPGCNLYTWKIPCTKVITVHVCMWNRTCNFLVSLSSTAEWMNYWTTGTANLVCKQQSMKQNENMKYPSLKHLADRISVKLGKMYSVFMPGFHWQKISLLFYPDQPKPYTFISNKLESGHLHYLFILISVSLFISLIYIWILTFPILDALIVTKLIVWSISFQSLFALHTCNNNYWKLLHLFLWMVHDLTRSQTKQYKFELIYTNDNHSCWLVGFKHSSLDFDL